MTFLQKEFDVLSNPSASANHRIKRKPMIHINLDTEKSYFIIKI